ncbi:interleukin-6 receptor subunit beta isoform X3 [Gadus macrocephalus]|uniref:interleukin-6 receptor subunit beta isoform X3 n=1 Tax=Gadus macrocephalus TaxID=80720 RepID=UPI0028CB3D7A|nr:interleukin-6 receptor subunit beta isoform X3 [Gadus macrocephalus]
MAMVLYIGLLHRLLLACLVSSGLAFSADPPERPENLSCVALQVDKRISNNVTCSWDTRKRGTLIETKTSLFFSSGSDEEKEKEIKDADKHRGTVTLSIFPHHMNAKVWVVSENKLGKVKSDVLETEADRFAKTNPPFNVVAISEKQFPESLLINWSQPIKNVYVKLIYQIRYCKHGSQTWSEIPLEDTAREIQSFRLQYLRPYTLYITQVRCKMYREGFGYWSDWSRNATKMTPEDKPKSKPDLWRTINNTEGRNRKTMHILCKDPELSNGRIRIFKVKMQSLPWTEVVVNRTGSQDLAVDLRQIQDPRGIIFVEVIACNSVGQSPKASLKIPRNQHQFPPVNKLMWKSDKGQLLIEWQTPNVSAGGSPPKHNLTEYVVQWVSGKDGKMDWQRENRSTLKTFIRGDLENFIYYNISVYPIYSDWIGQPVTIPAYLEQGAPSHPPSIKVEYLGSNNAKLVWTDIPQEKQTGFIVNYTLYYFTLNERDVQAITLPANTYSYHLKTLSSNTTYLTKVKSSTIKGSATSPEHMFITAKYAPGEVKGIVVGACLGFLFLLLGITILCFYKWQSIESKWWPTIPNPENSRIGTWTPDFHLKNEPPKENTLVDVSVVEVDMLDGKSVFEEDRAGLPLKKDKYLSEEHSSGIGDSSCMSSPRQSVSDSSHSSDEGGDLGETAAGAVQYSSVVASQGYKGQNPNAAAHGQQPQQQQQQTTPSFRRSESTQPLLECEDGGDTPGSSGQSRLLSPGSGYRSKALDHGSARCAEGGPPGPGEQGSAVLLRFWPGDPACQQSGAQDAAESPEFLEAVPASHCMTKLVGYRPQ